MLALALFIPSVVIASSNWIALVCDNVAGRPLSQGNLFCMNLCRALLSQNKVSEPAPSRTSHPATHPIDAENAPAPSQGQTSRSLEALSNLEGSTPQESLKNIPSTLLAETVHEFEQEEENEDPAASRTDEPPDGLTDFESEISEADLVRLRENLAEDGMTQDTANVATELLNENASFAESCGVTFWTDFAGRAVPSTTCWGNWVFGSLPKTARGPSFQIEGQKFEKFRPEPGLVTSTPALCQMHCQESAYCVRWEWVSPLDPQKAGQCALKTKRDVQIGLLVVQDTEEEYNEDDIECPAGTVEHCLGNRDRCIICSDEIQRCTTLQETVISGWKKCFIHDICLSAGVTAVDETIFGRDDDFGQSIYSEGESRRVRPSLVAASVGGILGLLSLGTAGVYFQRRHRRSRTFSAQFINPESPDTPIIDTG